MLSTIEHLILFCSISFILGVVTGLIVPMLVNAMICFYLQWEINQTIKKHKKLLNHKTGIEIPKTTSQWRTLLKQLLRSDDD